MRFLSSALTATIAVTLISGCSNNSAPPGVSAALPPLARGSQLGSFSQITERPNARVEPAASNKLYVADEEGNAISVYTSTGKYLYSITDQVRFPDAIAFDSKGNLYVANLGYGTGYGWVTVYFPGQTRYKYELGDMPCPNAIAIGGGNDLYAANSCTNSVSIVSLTVSSQDQVLTHNIQNPQGLAFDSNGVLYVANGGTPSNPNGSVAVCTGSPPSRVCNTTITSHIDNPFGIATTKGYLFVANDVPSGNITKYNNYANGNGYVNTWGQSRLNDPNALAFDSLGHICASSPGNARVVCLRAPDTLYKVITTGIGSPTSVANGPGGWLNVANFTTSKYADGSVTQYCPSLKTACFSPKTITSNIHGPASIGFGP